MNLLIKSCNVSNTEHSDHLKDAVLNIAFLKYRPGILNALFVTPKSFYSSKFSLFFCTFLSLLFHSTIFAAIALIEVPDSNNVLEIAAIETNFLDLDQTAKIKQDMSQVIPEIASEQNFAQNIQIKDSNTQTSAASADLDPIHQNMEKVDNNQILPLDKVLPVTKTIKLGQRAKHITKQNLQIISKPTIKSAKIIKHNQSSKLAKSANINPDSHSNVQHQRKALNEVSRSDYTALIVTQINERKIYPSSAREHGLSGVVSVVFTIGKTGRVNRVNIVKSSGEDVLDAAARQTLLSLSLPAPPGGYFNIQVPIRYSLTR